MTRTRWLPRSAATVLVVAALGVVSGCGHGGSSSAVSLPTASSSSGTTNKPASARHSLVGECHLVSARVLAGAVDTSHAVPCSHRHNVETVGTHAVFSKIDHATLQGYLDDCFSDAGNYFHLSHPEIDRFNVVPLAARSGHRTLVRCDLTVFPGVGRYFDDPPVVTTTSVRQEVAAGDTASWHWCTNQFPLGRDIPFSSCTSPHLQEAVLQQVAQPIVDGKYPSLQERTRHGNVACRKAVADRPDASQLGVSGFWPSKKQWLAQGDRSELEGICWFFRTDHHDLPALH